MSDIGRALIILGAVLIAVGVVASVVGQVPWLGRLPGDVYIKREHFSFYFPLTTSVLISVVLSLLLYLLRR
ncbi:MAG: DUF2905 domain-containing protein [Deltaproteobacteria bacterium]|nr:DUF2905 domain-containing protein [Deltaproteobacteria bacterium]MBI3386146.1 DUF2905 domain-containing protein [Deltaproteobacteria bacterium]